VIIRPPVNQSVCEGGTVNFTCVVMFPSGTLTGAAWFTNNDFIAGLPGHTIIDDVDGRSAPANVTNVLTITDVSISNNGTDYVCVQKLNTVMSNAVFLTVFGELYIISLYLFVLFPAS